ncbi:MAG: hypothetical protein ABSG02_14995 [Terriglobales bacterium]
MNRKVVPAEHMPHGYMPMPHRVWTYLILVIGCAVGALAQTASEPTNVTAPFSGRVTHLLGFEGAKNNAGGTLSIQGGVLQFQKSGKPVVEVSIASVQNVSLGEQSKQVGGLPMTLGKAATPYGGGRVVSLFAHKKYDTLALEYADANGGVHGAIFQLNKGQGQVLRNQLVARGVRVSQSDDAATKKSTAEVPSDNK